MAHKNPVDPVLLTIGTCNRRAGIVALVESFKRYHPTAKTFVCVIDRQTREMPPLEIPATIFFADELSLPGGRRFLFKYDAFELCCALKPFAIAHIVQEYGVRQLHYLDSDILVLNPFWHDLEVAWAEHSVLVTPHLVQLPGDMPLEFQRSIAQHGAYNGGFIAIKVDAESERFLSCWSNLLAHLCLSDPMNSLYVDQRWLDLLVASTSAVGVLRDPGLNVAYWNLHERRLTLVDGRWNVNGRPLKFFHFSGFDRERLTTKAMCDDSSALRLADVYGQALEQANDGRFHAQPYGWARYADGRMIERSQRDLILREHLDLADIADPFALPELIGWEKLEALTKLSQPARVSESYHEWERSVATLRRLRRHPVIGTVWKFWERFVNPSLRTHNPDDAHL
jgi:hypothetical protein